MALIYCCSFNVDAITPGTGWWNASESGRGFSIEQQGKEIFFATYLYDSAGKPTWFSAVLTENGNHDFTGILQQFKNGQTLHDSYQAPVILDLDEGKSLYLFQTVVMAN
ncbi:MAG: hypothetical protein K0U68_04595 [Gammaproteobacteria bacterium]|nr:hypothetical protein [Gammaproteobacteria bacterium]